MNRISIFALALALSASTADACTSLIAGKGATTDGSTIITYNADSYVISGYLQHTPAADHAPGEMLEVVEWDTDKPLGKIPQVSHTYSTIGNINEHQLAITESTFDCRTELADTTAIIDYGSLIYITLQRAKTAREAITVMTDLVAEHGYYSGGESFSIADPDEAWVLEMVSKGMVEKGAVWVARRIPDDCISGHANQSRIHQFPLNDKENCLYSADVITFARKMGWFDGKDEDFSFSKAYAVSDYLSYRGCDGRVWSYFNRFADGMDKYLPFIKGEGGETLPLYVKPNRKLSVRDIQSAMRDHFDGTEFDMTTDPGAGPWKSPYRYAPLIYEVDSVEYIHERPISTQQTGFTLVAQMRGWLPDCIGGILWFGVDDAKMGVYNPIYCCMNRVPNCYRREISDLYTLNWESAFWVNNWVANQAYNRFSLIYPDVVKVQNEIEDAYPAMTQAIEKRAATALKESPSQAVEILSAFSDSVSQAATDRYRKLGEYIFVKNLDGRQRKEENGSFKRTEYGYPVSPNSPGYSKEYYKRIVDETGTKFINKKME